MKGDDKVVSGLKNKAMVTASNIMPDTMVAAQMEKMQEPKDQDKKWDLVFAFKKPLNSNQWFLKLWTGIKNRSYFTVNTRLKSEKKEIPL